MRGAWLLLLWALPLAAAEPPRVEVPSREGAIVIDGVPGDAGWVKAAKIVLDQSPFGEDHASLWKERGTTVLLTYDKDTFYVAFECRKPSAPRSYGEKRDDNLYKGDAVEIFLDPVGDHKQHFELQFNAANLILDALFLYTGDTVKYDADGMNPDFGNQWDCREYTMRNLRSAASVLPWGWYVEVAIPAAELMRRAGKRQLPVGMLMRGNFLRIEHYAPEKTATGEWSSTIPGRPHRSPGRMGYIELK